MDQKEVLLLLNWYERNKRDLPWRHTKDPYQIWLSEVILQQTRISQGLDYYTRFLERFPDIASLAGATEDQVLKYWQGLGYYSRARNLLTAARTIHEKYEGVFPSHYNTIVSLKGIGDYTAAAVASLAFDQPYPVVDGNVYRVVARLLCMDEPVNSTAGKKRAYDFLGSLISGNPPGIFNQAFIELGALLCKPSRPACGECPLAASCCARKKDRIDRHPVPAPQSAIKERYFHYLVLHCYTGKESVTFLRKREAGDIWEGLYEFPLLEKINKSAASPLKGKHGFREMFGDPPPVALPYPHLFSHQLSHQKIITRFWETRLREIPSTIPEQWIKLKVEELPDYPVSRLIERYLDTEDNIFKK